MDGDNLEVNQNLEIVEEQTQNPQGDDSNLDIPDNQNDDTQDKEVEGDIFDPTKMTFDDVETSFNGYDLSSLKEKIGTNEDSVKALESYTSKFQELGLIVLTRVVSSYTYPLLHFEWPPPYKYESIDYSIHETVRV